MSEDKNATALNQLTEVIRSIIPILTSKQPQQQAEDKKKEIQTAESTSTKSTSKGTGAKSGKSGKKKKRRGRGEQKGDALSIGVKGEAVRTLGEAYSASGVGNIIQRQVTDWFEGSTKQIAAENIKTFAKAGITPEISELERLMDVARVENRITKDALNYLDVTSASKQWSEISGYLTSFREYWGFR